MVGAFRTPVKCFYPLPSGPPRPGPGFLAGAARPRTPGFTFGRPKVNRKTAKTKVLDSFVLPSLYQIWDISEPN